MVTKADKQAVVPLQYEIDDPTIEYPDSDGEPLAESDAQFIPLTYAVSALRILFSGIQDVYVGGDMLLYYILNDPTTSVAPDVFVVLGARGNHSRSSWIISREGGIAPAFVLEIASESTWQHDATVKRDIYAEMGVAEYWRFDPEGAHYPVPLIGERLVNGEYEPIAVETGADGIPRGHSAVLGLDICVRAELELRLYDPATGEWLRSHQESEDRIRQLEAQMRRHGITPNGD